MFDQLFKKVTSIACTYLNKVGCVINEVPERVKKGKVLSTSPIETLKKTLTKPKKEKVKDHTSAKGSKKSETQVFNHQRR